MIADPGRGVDGAPSYSICPDQVILFRWGGRFDEDVDSQTVPVIVSSSTAPAPLCSRLKGMGSRPSIVTGAVNDSRAPGVDTKPATGRLYSKKVSSTKTPRIRFPAVETRSPSTPSSMPYSTPTTTMGGR